MAKTPFVLPVLPPEIDYTSLIKEIGQAHNALGERRAVWRACPTIRVAGAVNYLFVFLF